MVRHDLKLSYDRRIPPTLTATTKRKPVANTNPTFLILFLAHLVNERCFLVVEGLTEITAVPAMFSLEFGQNPIVLGVRMLNGEGGIGARLFAKFLHTNNRTVIFMIDSDTKSSPTARHFTKSSLEGDGFDIGRQVYFIGNREFEDSFSDDIYLRVAQLNWPCFKA